MDAPINYYLSIAMVTSLPARAFTAIRIPDSFCSRRSMATNAMGITLPGAEMLFCRVIGNQASIILDTLFRYLIGLNASGIHQACNRCHFIAL